MGLVLLIVAALLAAIPALAHLGWVGRVRRSRGRLRDATTCGINSSGPGQVEWDLSMKTKTYFAFRIDIWADPATASLSMLLAWTISR